MANKKIQIKTQSGDNGYPVTKIACVDGLDNSLSSKATAAQGAKADTAVQGATIGSTAVAKIGTTLQLPAYPTSLAEDKAYTDSKVAAVKIGGVNILSGSKELLFSVATHAYDYKSFVPTRQIKPSSQYYFSANIEILAGNPSSVTIVFYDKNVVSVGGLSNISIINGHISGIIISNANTKIYYLLIYNGLSGSTKDNRIKLTDLKLETGNKPTDWTAAPEDIQTQINDKVSKSSTTAQNIAGVLSAQDFRCANSSTLLAAMQSEDREAAVSPFSEIATNPRNASFFEADDSGIEPIPEKDPYSLSDWKDYSPYIKVYCNGYIDGVYYPSPYEMIPRGHNALTLTPKDLEGFAFVKWIQRVLKAGVPTDIDLSTDRTVSVFVERESRFLAIYHNIPFFTINSYGLSGGSFKINGLSAPQSVQGATRVQISADPNSGMRLKQWFFSYDGGQTEIEYSLIPVLEFDYTVDRDVWFRPVFEPEKITITVQSSNPEYGTVSGSGEYDANATANISASAKTGYLFSRWTRNGQNQGLPQSFSYQVTQPDTWVAFFNQVPKYLYSVSGGIQNAQLFISLTKPVTYPTQGVDTMVEAYAGTSLYLFTAPSIGVVEDPAEWEIYDTNTDEIIASGLWNSEPISAQTTIIGGEFGGEWAIRER